jgi:hypothetical protein
MKAMTGQVSWDRGIELMREWQDTRCGPRTCIEFEEANPGGCEGCWFKGKITAPIVLGYGYENKRKEDQQTGEVAAILNADLWSVRPDLAPPTTGSAFIELLNLIIHLTLTFKSLSFCDPDCCAKTK